MSVKRRAVQTITTLDPETQRAHVRGYDGFYRRIVLEVASGYFREFGPLIQCALSRSIEVRILPAARMKRPFATLYLYNDVTRDDGKRALYMNLYRNKT